MLTRGLHIHLDPVGGVAGDMFIAAVLDAFPELTDGLLDTVRAAGFPAGVPLLVKRHVDHALSGLQFQPGDTGAGADRNHGHRQYGEIRTLLATASLPDDVREHAIGILDLLAEAESVAHGVAIAAVTFHELGSWDSIADVIGSAYLQAQLHATWSIGALPLGSGRISSAHGILPVPAPATALLLRGLQCIQDEIDGERVTPTGAAIIRHLGVTQSRFQSPRRLVTTGIGFGTRQLPGISNVLRVLAFESAADSLAGDRVAEILFEIDDQSPEDLSIGLDHIRAHPYVRDVLQMPAYGKKGRVSMQVRVLAEPGGLEAVTMACLRETSTIGLRYHVMDRVLLRRRQETLRVGDNLVNVKIAERLGRETLKVESESLLNVDGGSDARDTLRRAVVAAKADKEGQP